MNYFLCPDIVQGVRGSISFSNREIPRHIDLCILYGVSHILINKIYDFLDMFSLLTLWF
jgi:hypothetical protein